MWTDIPRPQRWQEPQKNNPLPCFMLVPLFTSEIIAERVAVLGKEITETYQSESVPLTVVSILTGSIFFAVDLVRQIRLHVKMDAILAQSYVHHASSGEVLIKNKLKESPAGANILLLDDIFDTGLTLKTIQSSLLEQGAASVKTCVLLDKELPPEKKMTHADWFAFRIPPKYVVGYGLDSDELYRNLPGIYELQDDDSGKPEDFVF